MSADSESPRLQLIRICQAHGMDVRHVLRLAAADLPTLAGYSDGVLLDYARALVARTRRMAGVVPHMWDKPVQCGGCGPVLLWDEAPARVIACPWCWNRRAGLPVPRPDMDA